MSLEVGTEFSSFNELSKALEAFESEQKVTYWRRDSRTLQAARKRGIDVDLDENIKYYELKYACLNGGRSFKSTSTGKRPRQRYVDRSTLCTIDLVSI